MPLDGFHDMTPHAARLRLAALIGAFLLAGCASTPPPRVALDAARIGIDEARSLGAQDYAPMELARAQQRLGDAESAFGQREYADADRLASHALLEAQLAQYRSRAATGREEVRRRNEENVRLRRELLGQGDTP
jgi:hypothetical protein